MTSYYVQSRYRLVAWLEIALPEAYQDCIGMEYTVTDHGTTRLRTYLLYPS